MDSCKHLSSKQLSRKNLVQRDLHVLTMESSRGNEMLRQELEELQCNVPCTVEQQRILQQQPDTPETKSGDKGEDVFLIH